MKLIGKWHDEFEKDIKNHSIDVVKDDNLYKHLIFSRNGSNVYRFEIITWPGYLCICGDMGDYVFQRIEDMFDFFRGDDVNPCYWGEKLQAYPNDGYKQYSPDKFKNAVKDSFAAYVEGMDKDKANSLWCDIEDEVLSNSNDGMIRAYDSTQDFDYNYNTKIFTDFWEVNVEEYAYRYIWCLYAIVWGINQYDKING